jgi:hypothetical protein
MSCVAIQYPKLRDRDRTKLDSDKNITVKKITGERVTCDR